MVLTTLLKLVTILSTVKSHDINFFIEENIIALKTCTNLLTADNIVPNICYEYILRNQHQNADHNSDSGQLVRTARRVFHQLDEINGPKCFDGPCQKQAFIMSVKVLSFHENKLRF